jgi:hypothetical protein
MAPLPAVAYSRAAARTLGGGHARDRFHRFGRITRLTHEGAPFLERGYFAALAHVVFFDQAFGDDDMRQGIDQRHIGAGPQFQMLFGGDMRRADQVDAARVRDDELGSLAQTAFHLRGKHRMTIGGIRADDENDVGFHHRIEILGAGRFPMVFFSP